MKDEVLTPQQPSQPVFLDLVLLLADIRHRWLWPVLGLFLGIVIALVALNFFTPRYTATLRVTPASSSQNGLSSTLSRLGGLASLAGVPVRRENEGASPFELYLDRIYSLELATQLAKDPRILRTVFSKEWNQSTRTFRDQPGPLRPVRNFLYLLSGQTIPEWEAPGGKRLQRFIRMKIGVTAPGPKDPPIFTLSFESPDPRFASYFLETLHRQADADVRAASLQRAERYAANLASKLESSKIAEHRKNLSEALLEQERAIMMATSELPFAAVPVEAASSSARPTTPSVAVALLAGATLGLLSGLVSVIVAHLRRQFQGNLAT